LRAGVLTAARIVAPPIERTVSLAHASGRALTRPQLALRGLIRAEIAAVAAAEPGLWRVV